MEQFLEGLEGAVKIVDIKGMSIFANYWLEDLETEKYICNMH